MDIVYFDQNIWSELKDFRKSNDLQTENLIKSKQISIVYSETNIKESLHIPTQYESDKELIFSIISEITNDTFINELGELSNHSPQELIDGIIFGERHKEELEKSIENLLQNQQNENPYNESFNYLHPENALKIVVENFIENIPQNSSSINTSISEKIIHNLLQTTLSQLEKYNPYTDLKYTKLRKEVFSMLEEYFSLTVKTNAKKFAESLTSQKPEDFLYSVLSQIPNKSEKISITQSLIGIFGYWRDSKKIMNQKKKTIDMEDYEHSKFIPYCKYFVTNDKHFSKRLKASISELEIQTKVLTLNDFLEEIKNS